MSAAGAGNPKHGRVPGPCERKPGAVDWLVGLLRGAGAFALYVTTLAPTMLGADAGEFQTVPPLLGVAHSTGYPLYTLLGWTWSHLVRVGDMAHRMNLFSAFWGALAVGLLYATTRALLRQALPPLGECLRPSPPAGERLAAALAAATFAVTPTFWSQSVIAEVYSLHALFVVLLFYLVLIWGERALAANQSARDEARLLLLAAFCFGLSLTHHRTTLLLAPALLAYVWLAKRRALLAGRLIVQALALVLLPLLLYLYIPWRAPHTPYLRLALGGGQELVLYDNTWRGFWGWVLGGPFGGSLDLSINWGARLSMAGGFFRGELGWAGLALAALGLASLAAGRRWRILALTGLAFLATVAFGLVYTIGDVIVLFVPAFLVTVLWMAAGVGAVAGALERRGRPARAVAVVVLLGVFALPAWMAVSGYPARDRSQDYGTRTFWQAVLAGPLPEGSILISNDRDEIMPLWYMQTVDDGTPQRPDVLGLFPLVTPEYPTLGLILDLALSTGRPAYLIKKMPGVEVKVQGEAAGDLWRIVGPSAGQEPAHRLDAVLGGEVRLVGYDRAPASALPGQSLRVGLQWEALVPLEAPYHTYVHLLNTAGDKVAQSDHQPGGVYYPATLWRVGERLLDEHALVVPADAPAGTYRLVAGMYRMEGGALTALWEPVVLGEVQVR